MWEEKNVFVTGADGFIGSWIAKFLVERKANVTVLIRDWKKNLGIELQGIKEKVNVVNGDLVDYKTIMRAMNEYEIEYCFHLGAQALVGTATRNPMSTFDSNIRGTWNIMEAARNSKLIKGVVVASSDKAYGIQKELPYTEESPLHGLYPYDASKACTDIIARAYFKSYGVPVAVTRNGNTYGGCDLNFSRIVPETIRCCLKGEDVRIRSDGTPERDYVYVKDIVNGYLKLGENVERFKGEAFNFGTEKPIAVLVLVNKIIELTNAKIKANVLGEATNEIDRQYLGTEKARKMLNWKAEYNLEEGLKETIEWYKNYFKK